MDKNKEVTLFIEEQNAGHKELLTTLRQLIEMNVPEVEEQFKWKRPVYALGSDFCYLKAARNYVTLGFFNFQKIDDPLKLLEGTGKQMRHLKLKSVEDINEEVLSEMIKQASGF
ncbi:MAG: DUF1801 domain-containing protein [Roseivirga sp.]|nr:DUF1801 domain-containing protein [Roseivirga sp.]